MKASYSSLMGVVALWATGCSDLQCIAGEERVANQCYPARRSDPDSGRGDTPTAEHDSGRATEAGLGVVVAAPIGLDASSPSSRDGALLPGAPPIGPVALPADAGIGPVSPDAAPSPPVGPGPDVPSCVPSAELCDGKDNDCNGAIDEAAPTWFQDCDGDGFAASTLGTVKSCAKPAAAGTCVSWTTTIPAPDTRSNWDCNDADAAYHPGADYGFPPAGSVSWDLNCDGVASPNAVYVQGDYRFRPCVTTVVEALRKPDGDCLPASNGCLLWKDGSDAFVTRPTATCPDTPHLAFFVSDEFAPSTCGTRMLPESRWTCR